jgi:hypothetical protein
MNVELYLLLISILLLTAGGTIYSICCCNCNYKNKREYEMINV